MSPPSPTSTPQPSAAASRAAERSAAHALAVAPRSRRTPRGQGQQPGLLVECDLVPARHRPDGQRDRRPSVGQQGEVAVVADGGHGRATVGSTSPSVSRAARSATAIASASSGLTSTVAGPGARHPLQARSLRACSVRAWSCPGPGQPGQAGRRSHRAASAQSRAGTGCTPRPPRPGPLRAAAPSASWPGSVTSSQTWVPRARQSAAAGLCGSCVPGGPGRASIMSRPR